MRRPSFIVVAIVAVIGALAYFTTQPFREPVDLPTKITSNGDDIVDGGPGNDTATFARATLDVQVDLAAGTAFGVETGRDTLISIENVIGGAGNDTIVGAADANKLSGGPGNDTLTGGLGDDLVDGGDGDDIAVFAGAFADYSFAQDVGTVTVVGADGTDILQGIETLRFDDKDVLVQDLPTASSD